MYFSEPHHWTLQKSSAEYSMSWLNFSDNSKQVQTVLFWGKTINFMKYLKIYNVFSNNHHLWWSESRVRQVHQIQSVQTGNKFIPIFYILHANFVCWKTGKKILYFACKGIVDFLGVKRFLCIFFLYNGTTLFIKCCEPNECQIFCKNAIFPRKGEINWKKKLECICRHKVCK